MIRIGNLNRRINIQARSSSLDAYGQPVQAWNTVYSCWASINVMQTALLYQTADFISQATYRIEIRYTENLAISAANQILWTDSKGLVHTYEIKSVINDRQSDEKLIILCYELGGAA